MAELFTFNIGKRHWTLAAKLTAAPADKMFEHSYVTSKNLECQRK